MGPAGWHGEAVLDAMRVASGGAESREDRPGVAATTTFTDPAADLDAVCCSKVPKAGSVLFFVAAVEHIK